MLWARDMKYTETCTTYKKQNFTNYALICLA